MIWIDLSTAPDPLFFKPIARRLRAQGHDVWITVRDYGETVAIASQCGLEAEVVGRHGGGTMRGKAQAIWSRSRALASRAAEMTPTAAVSFNSYAQAIAARRRRIPFITITDYEHQPANHLAFRLAQRVIVPEGFDPAMLRKQGARSDRVVFFGGLKEDVTLADFTPDPRFPDVLARIGIAPGQIVVAMRPPATSSSYHRFDNDFFYDVLVRVAADPRHTALLLPRYPEQAEHVRGLGLSNVIISQETLDGLNLVYWSDVVISAGGSMNREAVALGTPAYTVFAGRMAGVDEVLLETGALTHLRSQDDLDRMTIQKKTMSPSAIASGAVDEVLGAILAASARSGRG